MKRNDIDFDSMPDDVEEQVKKFIDDIETRVGNIKDKMDFSNYQRMEDFNGLANVLEEVHTAYERLEKLSEDLY